jgi:hypothetical protein
VAVRPPSREIPQVVTVSLMPYAMLASFATGTFLRLTAIFGKLYPTIRFNLNDEKVAHYRKQTEPTGEASSDEPRAAGMNVWRP